MNKIGAMTNHPPSMLYDVRHQLPTEIDFLSGAIAREADRAGVAAPLHTAIYRLIKGRKRRGLSGTKTGRWLPTWKVELDDGLAG